MPTIPTAFAALADAAIAGTLEYSGEGVSPKTLASTFPLDRSTTLVRHRLLEFLATECTLKATAGATPDRLPVSQLLF